MMLKFRIRLLECGNQDIEDLSDILLHGESPSSRRRVADAEMPFLGFSNERGSAGVQSCMLYCGSSGKDGFMTLNAVVLALLLMPQSAPGVDDQKVAAAIERGVAWLRKAPSTGHSFKKDPSMPPIRNSDDLLLLTFLHAGVPEDDPRVRELLASALAAPLDKTYPVALRAMVLEELDRVRYQSHIARLAQYLVDNQLANGQWGYGTPAVTADAM